MSLTLNMVGGGSGGGITDTDAILRVQAPAGSTVTITKGAVTKTDNGHENADDNTIYDYYFVIHQSQFDSINPWTITATLSMKTATETIIIDSPYDYFVTIVYEVYLIKSGQVIATFTGQGFTSGTNYATMTKSGNVAYISVSTKYDLTEYNTIRVVVYDSSGRSFSNPATCPSFGVGVTQPTIDSNSAVVSNYTAYKKFSVSNNYIQAGTYDLDISQLTGEYYIALAISGSSNYTSSIHVSNFFIL